MDQLDQAEALLNNAPEKIASAPELEAVRAQIALARQAGTPVRWPICPRRWRPIRRTIRRASTMRRRCMPPVRWRRPSSSCWNLFRRDREWNDSAAKTQLFTIFDALKPTDPIVQKGRRRLSSMIFA
jgi:putative thioredoxin